MVLRRREQEFTNEYLAQLIVENSIGRNEDLHSFILLLDRIEGGYSIFLDGKWGSGKTIFVKQAILVLRVLNSTYDNSLGPDITAAIGKSLDDLKPTKSKSYLPVYYNAWENDVYVDPTVTLLGALIAESGYDFFSKKPRDASDKLAAAADAILKQLKLDSVASLKKEFTAKDLMESMKAIQAVQSNFKDLVLEMLRERGDKLVLFIDELDRCTPSFALRLIEQIKFVLTMDNVILVFSTDVSQLAHTIEGYYGSGFNGSHYLTRYYDLNLTLKGVLPSDFLAKQGLSSSETYFDSIVREMANHHSFSMRDCLRYLEDIDRIREIALSAHGCAAEDLLAGGLAPVIYAVKMDNSDLYHKIIFGKAEDELLTVAKNSPTFERLLTKFFDSDNAFRGSHNEPTFSNHEEFCMAVYRESFDDAYRCVLKSAGRLLRAFSCGNPNQLVGALFGVKTMSASP